MAPNPVLHPLGPPVISGTEITVDLMLKQPTRITRMLMDLTLQRFFVDRVFTSAGGVTGGAVVYDQATENELYLSRDIGKMGPGTEAPIVTSERRAPRVAQVDKWGGKFPFTDEARDRNDAAAFTNQLRQLGNTVVRKINAIGAAELQAAIVANGGSSTFVGNDWSAAIPNGSNPSIPSLTPAADLAKVGLLAEQRELGLVFDFLLINPVDWNVFVQFYGAGNVRQVLSDNGITDYYVSNRVTVGSPLVIASGQVGEMRVEQPLQTVTEREGAPLLREQTWVQSTVRPMFYVTNPFAVMQITGV